jgi:PST family polysaccharide transporter
VPHRKTIAIVATTLAGLGARISALAAQAIVGIYLTEEQLGSYALAIGVLGVTAIWRNGGSATYLPSLRPEEFEVMAPRMFGWASGFAVATALLTAAVALSDPYAPGWLAQYRVPGLTPLLLVLALQKLVFPVALIGRMRLAVEHRFTSLARADAFNALARLVLTWAVAANGGGALALAIPYTAGTVFEIVAVAALGGYRRRDFAVPLGGYRTLAKILAWPLALAVLNSMRLDVSFLVIGAVLPAAALGLFYFAFQLANQPTMLLATSLQNVLAPMLARSRGSFESERFGMERVFASAMLFVPITTMAAASFFPAAERLVWDGKWAQAGPSVTLLCIGATYATVAALMLGPLLGLQRFKAAAWFEFLKMLGIIVGALVGAVLVRAMASGSDADTPPVTVISATVAVGMVATSLAQLLWAAGKYGIPGPEVARNLTFGPLLAGLTAVAATSIGHSITESFPVGGGRTGAFVELAAIGSIYTLLIMLALRFTAESTLRDSVAMLPPAVRKFANKVFVLE